jgi:hypothetical protein
MQNNGLGYDTIWFRNKSCTAAGTVTTIAAPQPPQTIVPDRQSTVGRELPQVDSVALRAYRLPSGPEGRTRSDIDARFQARLDLRFAVRRSAFLAVLADPAGHDLAAALNETELRLPFNPRRTWLTLHVGSPAPSRPSEGGIGIVVIAGPDNGIDATLTQVLKLRVDFPGSPVVCQVRRTLLPDCIGSAAQLARRCDQGEFLAYTQVLKETPSRGRRTTPSGEAPAALVGALLDMGAVGMPEDTPDVASLPPETPPGPFAEQLVEELNRLDPWGEAEPRVIAAVRSLLPHLFPAVLCEHAANRDYPARYASLRTAARTDEETDLWIDAARSCLPRPGRDIPLRLIGVEVADALVLGLIRTRELNLAAAWSALASRDVKRVRSAAADGMDAETFLIDASASEAAAALRGGIGRGLHIDMIPQAPARPQYWALIAGRGLTPALAAWLGQDYPLDQHLRRLLCDTGTPTLREEEALAPIRNALWPPLPST